jgi:hypothetical protein
MKTKTNPTAPAMPAITHPTAIIERHLKPALAPFAADLLEAARKDREAEAAMEAMHPETAKKEAEALFERAAQGDKAADKKLLDAGGKEKFIKDRTAHFDLARAKREHAAVSAAPIWVKVANAGLPALEAAKTEIQSQYAEVMLSLGEGKGGLSNWNTTIDSMKNALAECPRRAGEVKHGTDWLLRSYGLGEHVGLE